MRVNLKEAEDVDTMIHVHSAYIKTTIDQALLGGRLELIHKTILKVLDLGIKLEDAQAANALAHSEALEQQEEMMNLSMASMGLHTPKEKSKHSKYSQKYTEDDRQERNSSSDDDDDDCSDADMNLSKLSAAYNIDKEIPFVAKIQNVRDDFDRLVRFVASGLGVVARTASGEEARRWDILGTC